MKDGLTQRDICARLKLPQPTVSHIMKEIKDTGQVGAGKSSGRRWVTSSTDDRAIKICANRNPTLSSLQIKIEANVQASTRTIRRRLLNDFGLCACRSAKKPMLNRM